MKCSGFGDADFTCWAIMRELFIFTITQENILDISNQCHFATILAAYWQKYLFILRQRFAQSDFNTTHFN